MLWLALLLILFFGFWRTVKFAVFYVFASVAAVAALLLFALGAS